MKRANQQKITGFRAHAVQRHRNGVAGRPFHTVNFSFDCEGTFKPNMLAIFPEDANTEAGAGPGTECFVVDLSNPTSCWRGDNFVNDVIDAIEAHQRESARAFKACVFMR